MSQRKLDLQARVNGDLALDFSDIALTSYAGLALFARYLRRIRFNALSTSLRPVGSLKTAELALRVALGAARSHVD